MKLLLIVNRAEFFLSHRLPIALAAREQGYDVHVAAAERGHGESLSALGFPFHPVDLSPSGRHPARELRALFQLRRILASVSPDLIHCVTLKPILYGGFWARRLQVPAVLNALTGLGHVFIARDLQTRMLRVSLLAAFRHVLRHSNQRTVFQNPDDQRLFVDLGLLDAGQAVVIRSSGVDVDRFRPTPEPDGAPTVIFPSRMLRTKGLLEFIEAARLLGDSSSRFVLVGGLDPDNPAGVAEAEIRGWVREGVVEWWGHRPDMPAVFGSCNVVCLPSYREGLPKALVEAAACARPIVTTDVPGCREIVRDGYNGFTVPPRDARALAHALHALLIDPELRERMGRNGRQVVEAEFRVEDVVAATLCQYRALVDAA